MKKELIVHEDPKSPVSEIFRTLRTNIQFTYTKNSLKTILITSTMPGEGKSWIASNLSVTFAQAGKKTILIDADMRKGRQYTIFGVSPRPGLSNYLSGVDANAKGEASEDIANYIQETSVKNLYVIAAGNIPPNPSELLASEQMEEMLNQLKTMCDIVIVDGTPNQLVTDSLILTRMVDSTVIVSASHQTKKEDLKRIVTNIKNVGGKIAGIVVNKIPTSVKKYNQAYYYGSTAVTASNSQSYKKGKRIGTNKVKSESVNNEKNDEKVEVTYTEEPQTQEVQISSEEQKNVDYNATTEEATSYSSYQQIPMDNVVMNNQPIIDENNEVYLEGLNRKINVEAPNISIEETENILRQVNEYLEQEKKNLN